MLTFTKTNHVNNVRTGKTYRQLNSLGSELGLKKFYLKMF